MTRDQASGPRPSIPLRHGRGDDTLARTAEDVFSDVVHLATAVSSTPGACLLFPAAGQLRAVTRVGIAADDVAGVVSFATHVVTANGPVMVSDAQSDPLMATDSPQAASPAMRFYAGVPVGHGGLVSGVLVVVDVEPRTLAEETVTHLSRLARQVQEYLTQHARERAVRQTEADSETRLRGFMTHLEAAQRIAAVGSWENRLRQNRLTWSDEIYRIFGITRDQFAASFDAFVACVHPDDRAAVLVAHEDTVAGRGPLEIEHRIVRPDGTVRHVRERGELYLEGNELVLAGTVQDITDQVRSTRQFETFFALSVDSMCIVTFDGTFVRVNEAMTRLLGLAEAHLQSLRIGDLVHPDDERGMHDEIATLVAGVPSVAYEIRCRTVEGDYRTLAWSIRPVQDEALLYCVVRDDTERVRAEDLLRESEERFREMAETIEDVFWTRDTLVDRLVYVSPSYDVVFGQSREELYRDPRSFQRLMDPEDLPRLHEALRRDPFAITIEYRIVRPDGERRWIDARTFPVRDETGRVIRVVGIARDITRLKNAEQALLRTQRIESIGTLAGGIAHDINNVLTPIVMAAGVLAATTRTESEADLVATIAASAERGASMVRQVLSFARGVEGRRVPLRVEDVVADIGKLIRDTFERRIDLDIATAPGLWTVSGDATQLHQVLLNLAVNARDAMPDGGRLTLYASNVLVDRDTPGRTADTPDGRYVALAVSDTGTGVPAALHNRVFDPFFTTKPQGRGTGLGLSTVQTLVRGHGGFLTLRSEVGVGTTFTVYLPAVNHAQPEASDGTFSSAVGGNGRLVLVVDDEDAVRTVARAALELSGYRVVAAADGAAALAVFRERPDAFAAVVTDMMMPVMDGYELIDALLRIRPSLPIVASSGLETQGMAERVFQCGVRQFLSKPYTSDTLLQTLAQALGQEGPGAVSRTS